AVFPAGRVDRGVHRDRPAFGGDADVAAPALLSARGGQSGVDAHVALGSRVDGAAVPIDVQGVRAEHGRARAALEHADTPSTEIDLAGAGILGVDVDCGAGVEQDVAGHRDREISAIVRCLGCRRPLDLGVRAHGEAGGLDGYPGASTGRELYGGPGVDLQRTRAEVEVRSWIDQIASLDHLA